MQEDTARCNARLIKKESACGDIEKPRRVFRQ